VSESNRPSDSQDATLRRDSPYSYRCGACSRCCRNYLIRVNPYELLRLARHLGMSCADFTRDYVGADTALRHKPDDTCIFLGPQGCMVHPVRPLACRLYPLGRHVSGEDVETFFPMQPHPETKGIYGTDGTVDDYLRAQGAHPYIAAIDRYLAIFRRYYHVLARMPKDGLSPSRAETDTPPPSIPSLLDPEMAVAMIHPGSGLAALDAEAVMALHIEALAAWLSQQRFEENADEQKD